MAESGLIERLGRYELIGKIAVGGMAELYLASIAGPGGFRKFVALKRILPFYRQQPSFRGMFLDEARISASLSHANIAQVFELGEVDEELFLTMEFVAGRDITQVMKKAIERGSHLPLDLVCTVMRDTALALHHAHHFTDPSAQPFPIIHRDISPHNVMVTYAGSIKVIDFGIAKAKVSVASTNPGRIKGTSAYMSPEQIMGEPLDGRSDLFSLAIVFYEMLTLTRAFRGADQPSTIEAVLKKMPPPPHEIAPHVPRELSDVVMKALSKERDARFASGRDFAREIETAALPLGEESVSRWMASAFVENIEQTRKFFSLANAADQTRLAEAAVALRQQEEESGRFEVRNRSGQTQSNAMTAVDNIKPLARPTPAPRDTTILIVDDSETGRRIVQSVLQSSGYQIIAAESGVHALEVLEHLRPDLIVLDVRMPGMDGFELCLKIRQNPTLRLTPILFLSAACSIEERSKGLDVGGDDFVRKPFDSAEFVGRVRVHLQKAALLRGATGTGEA